MRDFNSKLGGKFAMLKKVRIARNIIVTLWKKNCEILTQNWEKYTCNSKKNIIMRNKRTIIRKISELREIKSQFKVRIVFFEASLLK